MYNAKLLPIVSSLLLTKV